MTGSKRSKRVDSSQFVPVHRVERDEKPNEVAFVLRLHFDPGLRLQDQHSAAGVL
jgi:hypothetical protein